MVKITKATDLTDEIKRENSLQAIEKAATTDQLQKLEKLATKPELVAMLDQFEI